MDTYDAPVLVEGKFNDVAGVGASADIGAADRQHLQSLANQDPLYQLSDGDKAVLWRNKRYCRTNHERILPLFLQAVPWQLPAAAQQARAMLSTWPLPNAVSALELLNSSFGDGFVRSWAVSQIQRLDDAELHQLLLQLVQVLKYDMYAFSPLSCLLLYRSLRSPLTIGHRLFWLLRSEVGILTNEARVRYAVVLEAFCKFCGSSYRGILDKQVLVNDILQTVADGCKDLSKDHRLSGTRDLLREISDQLPATFQLPLSSKYECQGLRIEKCNVISRRIDPPPAPPPPTAPPCSAHTYFSQVMSSKKLPLWLVFEADGTDLYVIYKSGDDLRQDEMTLQMVRLVQLMYTIY
jgi:phosphatidylinositol-4,5-bisphosphate 3-kinase